LARIWPVVEQQVVWQQEVPVRPVAEQATVIAPLVRVPLAWYAAVPSPRLPAAVSNPLRQLTAPTLEARTGTVIHRLIEQLTRYGSESWLARGVERKQLLLQPLLQQGGMTVDEITNVSALVIDCIDTMLNDERGQWLLQRDRAESSTEWELMTAAGQRYVVDRSFVDDAGVRWIIDYKSSQPHAGEPLADFLRRESAAYAPQLQLYRELVAQIDTRPIKTALYFPRIPHWLEIKEA
jgi:ATP-dependent exoDNAse (exonuclease V) beta subunit